MNEPMSVTCHESVAAKYVRVGGEGGGGRGGKMDFVGLDRKYFTICGIVHTQTHTYTRTHVAHARAHAHTRTHAHTHVHSCAHEHTHILTYKHPQQMPNAVANIRWPR